MRTPKMISKEWKLNGARMETAEGRPNRRRSSARKRELVEKLAFAVEYGTEEEFVAAVKKFKPDVGKEELKAWIMQFAMPGARSAGSRFIYNLVEFLFCPAELFGRHAFFSVFHQIAEGIDQRFHRRLRFGFGLCHDQFSIAYRFGEACGRSISKVMRL
jgi:hypothetical protein